MEFILLLLPLAILLMMAFAIKDIFTRPMEQTHQILWLLVILAFPSWEYAPIISPKHWVLTKTPAPPIASATKRNLMKL